MVLPILESGGNPRPCPLLESEAIAVVRLLSSPTSTPFSINVVLCSNSRIICGVVVEIFSIPVRKSGIVEERDFRRRYSLFALAQKGLAIALQF